MSHFISVAANFCKYNSFRKEWPTAAKIYFWPDKRIQSKFHDEEPDIDSNCLVA